jgi:hypothetical protein
MVLFFGGGPDGAIFDRGGNPNAPTAGVAVRAICSGIDGDALTARCQA